MSGRDRGLSTAGAVASIFGAVLALGLLLGLLGFVFGWFNKAAEVAGPDNVSEQYHDVAQEYESLQAAAANACAVVGSEMSDSTQQFIEDPAVAYEATYRKIASSYNRRMTNIFEAGLVGPRGYPERVEIPVGDVDWCGLVSELEYARG